MYEMENSTLVQVPFPQPPSPSHLATMYHINLAMATKPPQLMNYEASINVIKMSYLSEISCSLNRTQ